MTIDEAKNLCSFTFNDDGRKLMICGDNWCEIHDSSNGSLAVLGPLGALLTLINHGEPVITGGRFAIVHLVETKPAATGQFTGIGR